MNWNAEIEDGSYWLRLTILKFFGFVELLMQVANGSNRHNRRHVVETLRRADALARTMIVREAGHAGYPLPPLPDLDYEGSSIDDALRMAAAFQSMAMILSWLCQNAPHLRRRHLRRKFAGRHMTRPRPGTISRTYSRGPHWSGFRALDSPSVTRRILPCEAGEGNHAQHGGGG